MGYYCNHCARSYTTLLSETEQELEAKYGKNSAASSPPDQSSDPQIDIGVILAMPLKCDIPFFDREMISICEQVARLAPTMPANELDALGLFADRLPIKWAVPVLLHALRNPQAIRSVAIRQWISKHADLLDA
jgi:hypothetical protein